MADIATATSDLLADTNYAGFVAFIEKLGGKVAEVTFDADGVVEVLIGWPNGYQIVSPKMAHRGQ